uniref:Uncharacterized protein n=1 Tax=Rhizophora mucronata TaxID=61149 RepID=A0A2P2PL52_RHIMU
MGYKLSESCCMGGECTKKLLDGHHPYLYTILYGI